MHTLIDDSRRAHRHCEVPVSRRRADRRAVAAVHDRVQPRRRGRRERVAARCWSGSCRSPRWCSRATNEQHQSATGRRSTRCMTPMRHAGSIYAGGAVVLGARRVQLLPDPDRHRDAGARTAPLPAAVSPANRADHRRRDRAVGRQPALSHPRAAGQRPRPHADRVRGVRRVLHAGASIATGCSAWCRSRATWWSTAWTTA